MEIGKHWIDSAGHLFCYQGEHVLSNGARYHFVDEYGPAPSGERRSYVTARLFASREDAAAERRLAILNRRSRMQRERAKQETQAPKPYPAREPFLATMTPRAAVRADAALQRTVRHNGKVMRRADMIRALAARGIASVCFSSKRLTLSDGAFLTSNDITLTGMRYAAFLSAIGV